MEEVTITIRNRHNGKTASVKADKLDGMHIYNISAAQFDRVRHALGRGPIETDSGRVDAYKRSGTLHAVIEPSAEY